MRRSPDWSLQLDSMKSESLVIVNQNVTVNTFPGLVHTARHTMGVGCKLLAIPTSWSRVADSNPDYDALYEVRWLSRDRFSLYAPL